MDDFRVPVGFLTHHKTRKLRRRLGADGVIAYLQLWDFCTRAGSRNDGSLRGMSAEDIALDAEWGGDPDDLVAGLVEVGFLDGEPGEYRIHEWAKIQPYVATHEQRVEAGRKGAQARWRAHGQTGELPAPPVEEPIPCPTDADRTPDGWQPHAGAIAPAMPIASTGNAPSPAPTPLPAPVSMLITGGVAGAVEIRAEKPAPKRRTVVAGSEGRALLRPQAAAYRPKLRPRPDQAEIPFQTAGPAQAILEALAKKLGGVHG